MAGPSNHNLTQLNVLAAETPRVLAAFPTNLTIPPLPLSLYVWAFQQVIFHAVGLLFEYSDRTGALRDAKVRGEKAWRRSYDKLLPQVLFNQTFLLLPSMMLAEYMGWGFSGTTRLHPLRFVANLPAMAIGHDVVQYVFHRFLLHQPNIKLMRFLRHSVHHSTRASTAISACYMSPQDFCLEIVLPYLLPLAMVGGGGADWRFHFMVAGSGAIGGLYEHSGYDFSAILPGVTAKMGDSAAKTEGIDAYEPDFTSYTWAVVRPLLAGFLDNRAHSEHHWRGNVSFSDGFGSPGACDTLFKTRWDLVNKDDKPAVEREWQRLRREDGVKASS